MPSNNCVILRWPWLRRAAPPIATFVIFALTFAMRFHWLAQSPYPPSGDAGGDLYLAHAWLGESIPQLNQSLVTPPFYFFAVIIPLTTLFQPYLGIEIAMALVPAAAVFPAYCLGRELRLARIWAVVASTFVGTSALFSLMVTWNSAFNMFGIFLLLWNLYFLLRYLRSGSGTMLLATALTFLMVGLAHPLTFLFDGITIASLSVFVILFRHIDQRFKRVGFLWLNLFLVSFALLFFYMPEGQAARTSYSPFFLANLQWLAETALFFGWGYQGVASNLLALIDIGLTVGGLITFIGLRDRTVAKTSRDAIVAILIAAGVIALANPANGIRALYFLPVPFSFCAAGMFQRTERWSRNALTSGRPLKMSKSAGLQRWRHGFAFHSPSKTIRVVCLTAAVGILLANGLFSVDTLQEGIHFYMDLNPDRAAALNWIRSNTTPQSVFFDAAGMSTWIWGYTGRMAYAPSPLSIDVTQQSYAFAYQCDLVNAGTYLVGDEYLLVAHNYPSPYGGPAIYLATPNGWDPLFLSQTNLDSVSITHSNLTRTIGLQYASLLDASASATTTAARYAFALEWTSPRYVVRENASIAGEGAWLNWSGLGSSNVRVNLHFGVPPSGYYFNYLSVPPVTNVTSLQDSFQLPNGPFTVEIFGGNITQYTTPSGWTSLNINGSQNLSIQVTHLTGALVQRPFAIDTWGILEGLGINYIVVDWSQDYSLAYRLQSHAIGGGSPTDVFKRGTISIYAL